MAGGQGLTREKYKRQLAIERITGLPLPSGFKSKAMQKGNDDEPLAREHYEFVNDVDVVQVGFIFHPWLEHAGVSPDGLVGDDGVLEIKCPNIETHLGYILTKKIPADYKHQINWGLACTDREWCDFVTFSKEMPINLRQITIKVYRDDKAIKSLEEAALKFNEEVEQLINQLRNL
jgi:hypothetical protein